MGKDQLKNLSEEQQKRTRGLGDASPMTNTRALCESSRDQIAKGILFEPKELPDYQYCEFPFKPLSWAPSQRKMLFKGQTQIPWEQAGDYLKLCPQRYLQLTHYSGWDAHTVNFPCPAQCFWSLLTPQEELSSWGHKDDRGKNGVTFCSKPLPKSA